MRHERRAGRGTRVASANVLVAVALQLGCLVRFTAGMATRLLSLLATIIVSCPLSAANPIITDVFTADPVAVVYNDTLYLYTSHDEATPEDTNYVMNDWLCFSTTNMVDWEAHGAPLSAKDFEWGGSHAYAGHVVERDGTFYWYVPMGMKNGGGFGIGVATSSSPNGPFKDALGHPLISSDMTPDPVRPGGMRVTWDDIDPAVFIDDDGEAYIFWGNSQLRWAKLKNNLVELDGAIHNLDFKDYVEAPFVHKRGDTYYLTYASGFPERTAYATASSITGPWTYQGEIMGLAGNCSTNHQAIVDYKGRSYFIYHNGALSGSGNYRRSVCVDYLHYDGMGRIKPIVPTMEGVVAVDEPLPAAMGGEKQNWVIVHGAWAGAWEWQKVGRMLEADGKRVYRTTHTGNGERNHLSDPSIDLETHINDVVNVIVWEDLHDIVLVGHSYGGMVITGVADRVPERISQVIYLDAALPDDGQNIYDTFGGQGRMPSEGGFTYPGKFDPNTPVPHIVPQSNKTFETPISLPNQKAARALPTTYILTADDLSAPEKDGFYPSYEKAVKRGWSTQIMHATHVPQNDQPENLVKLLLEIVVDSEPE